MPARRVEELAAGASAGLFATALLHPLDLIKTRMQVQDARSQGRRLPMYRGLFHGVRSIVSLEGWAGLFQGLGPNLIGSTTSWGLYMYLYALCKDWLAPRMPPRARTPSWQTSRASTAHTPQRSSAPRQACCSRVCASPWTDAAGSALYLGAATAAGTAVTLVVHPIYMIKTRLQLQLHSSAAAAAAAAATAATAAAAATAATAAAATGAGAGAGMPPLVPPAIRNDYRGVADAVARIVREEGALSLYRGLGPSLLLVSHGSLQVRLRDRVSGQGQGQAQG
jgi:solute carrier family 25 folate transporter 32